MAYQPEVTKFPNGYSVQLTSGDSVSVDSGIFHKILNIGQKPAFYMYWFYNSTDIADITEVSKLPDLPVITELYIRSYKIFTFGNILLQNLFQMFFSLSNC